MYANLLNADCKTSYVACVKFTRIVSLNRLNNEGKCRFTMEAFDRAPTHG